MCIRPPQYRRCRSMSATGLLFLLHPKATLKPQYPLWHVYVLTQLCPTLCDPMDCSLPVFSVHGIFQAGILEVGAISFSRGSSQPRHQSRVSCVSCIAGGFFTAEPLEKPFHLATPMPFTNFETEAESERHSGSLGKSIAEPKFLLRSPHFFSSFFILHVWVLGTSGIPWLYTATEISEIYPCDFRGTWAITDQDICFPGALRTLTGVLGYQMILAAWTLP